MKLPDPPPPEVALAVECDRCVRRGEWLRRRARGLAGRDDEQPPTIPEIREAIDELAAAEESGVPLGQLVPLGTGRARLDVCPRHTPAPKGEVSIARAKLNRRERRGLRLR